MKLKTFNRNSLERCTESPILSLSARGGRIHFNGTLSRIMGLTDKCTVSFHQDQDSPADWYITINTDKYGFGVRSDSKGKKGSRAFVINSTPLSQEIRKSINASPGELLRMLVAEGLTEKLPGGTTAQMFNIITASCIARSQSKEDRDTVQDLKSKNK